MGQDAGQVQHDDEQRHLKRDPEGQQHRHDEAHVLVDLGNVRDTVWRQAEQVVHGPAQREVRERGANQEQRDGCAEEDVTPALLPGVQAGRYEGPDLIEPDRGGQDHPDNEGDLHPQVKRVKRPVQGELVDAERLAARVTANHGRAQRPLDGMPDRGEEDEPEDHPADEPERHLDDAVAQLTDVIHERHPAVRVLLPLRAHETLTHDASALNGTGKFRHDRFPQ